MKRYLIITVGLCAMLTGCLSSPIAAPSKVEDSLLVIKTETKRLPGISNITTDYFHVLNSDSVFAYPKKPMGFLYFTIDSDDSDIYELERKVTKPDFIGDDYTMTFELNLPYSAGEIVIAPYKVIQITEERETDSYATYYDVVSLTEEEYGEILGEIKTNPLFKNWIK